MAAHTGLFGTDSVLIRCGRRVGRWWTGTQRWHHAVELNEVYEQLEILLKAGIPMEQALQHLAATVRHRTDRNYVNTLLDALHEGIRLSAVWSDRLPAMLGVLLHAGEESGMLPDVLASWRSHVNERREWHRRLLQLLSYPLLLCALSIALLAFVSIQVLPSLRAMYDELSVPAPWKAVWLQHFLVQLPLVFVITCAASAIVVPALLLLRNHSPRLWAAFTQHTPFHEWIVLSRTESLCAGLSLLAEAGLPIGESLRILAAVSPAWLQRACMDAERRLLAGEPLMQTFAGPWHGSLRLFMELAEQTGDLAMALRRVERVTRESFVRRVRNALRILEPSLVFIAGGVVLGTMWMVLSPVYDMVTTVSSQTLR